MSRMKLFPPDEPVSRPTAAELDSVASEKFSRSHNVDQKATDGKPEVNVFQNITESKLTENAYRKITARNLTVNVSERQPDSKPNIFRTGRDQAISIKTSEEVRAAFYAMAQDQGWRIGETFERAMEVLAEAIASGRKWPTAPRR